MLIMFIKITMLPPLQKSKTGHKIRRRHRAGTDGDADVREENKCLL